MNTTSIKIIAVTAAFTIASGYAVFSYPSFKVESEAKSTIEAMMRVEGSAKFENVRSISENTVVCGRVSGKNAFGAQLQYQEFAYLVKPKNVMLADREGEYVVKVFCHQEIVLSLGN